MRLLSSVVKFPNVVEDAVYLLSQEYKNRAIHDFSDKEEALAECKQIIKAAKHQALSIITEAREQALQIKNSAEREKEKTLEQAKKEGYQMGFERGVSEAESKKSDMLKEICDLLSELHSKKERIIEQNKLLIKEMVLDIARKVLDAEIDENKHYFLNLFKKAVEDFSAGERLKISVSPHEYEFVTSNADLLLSLVKEAKYIDVVKLDGHPKGTCIVESSNGIVDSSIKTQLKIIEQALAGC